MQIFFSSPLVSFHNSKKLLDEAMQKTKTDDKDLFRMVRSLKNVRLKKKSQPTSNSEGGLLTKQTH